MLVGPVSSLRGHGATGRLTRKAWEGCVIGFGRHGPQGSPATTFDQAGLNQLLSCSAGGECTAVEHCGLQLATQAGPEHLNGLLQGQQGCRQQQAAVCITAVWAHVGVGEGMDQALERL